MQGCSKAQLINLHICINVKIYMESDESIWLNFLNQNYLLS